MNQERQLFILVMIILYDASRNEGSYYLKLSDQLFGSRRGHDDVSCSRRNKAFINSLVNETQQGIVIAVHIQKPHLQKIKPT